MSAVAAAAAVGKRRARAANPLAGGAAPQVVHGGMSPAMAQKMLGVSLVTIGAVVGYDLVRNLQAGTQSGDDAFRTVWSMGLLVLLLAIMTDLAPGIGGPFAGLVALAVLVGRGAAVKQIVNVIPSKGATK